MPPYDAQTGDSGARASEAAIRSVIESYVRELKAAGAIRSPGVERAMLTVQRHHLLESFSHRESFSFRAGGLGPGPAATVHHDPGRPRLDHLELIYSNTALMTRSVDGMPTSSSSQPSLVAEMLELLDLSTGTKVLEIGAGTGYTAALMAELVGDQRLVVTVDVQDDVVAQTKRLLARAGYPQIQVLVRDGFEGLLVSLANLR
jgi:protein-L-isoaspartate(D-aspartate) O-methyltransferase